MNVGIFTDIINNVAQRYGSYKSRDLKLPFFIAFGHDVQNRKGDL